MGVAAWVAGTYTISCARVRATGAAISNEIRLDEDDFDLNVLF